MIVDGMLQKTLARETRESTREDSADRVSALFP